MNINPFRGTLTGIVASPYPRLAVAEALRELRHTGRIEAARQLRDVCCPQRGAPACWEGAIADRLQRRGPVTLYGLAHGICPHGSPTLPLIRAVQQMVLSHRLGVMVSGRYFLNQYYLEVEKCPP